MQRSSWVLIPVTEWVDDSDERFATSHGELTNLEWLQIEKGRLMREVPHSRPFIRIHPKYFDKDSHSRRCYKQIALYRFADHGELVGDRKGRRRSISARTFPKTYASAGLKRCEEAEAAI